MMPTTHTLADGQCEFAALFESISNLTGEPLSPLSLGREAQSSSPTWRRIETESE